VLAFIKKLIYLCTNIKQQTKEKFKMTTTEIKTRNFTDNTETTIPKKMHYCVICGELAEMTTSRGPACPEHYDDLSD